jgi:SAM-dependent methyltransferase
MIHSELDTALRQADRVYGMLQQSCTSSAGFERGVWANYINGERGYLGYLPTFQNQTFLEILEAKARQSLNKDDITFVDLGYGRGRVLIDLSEYPPTRNKVRLIGVGPTAYSKLEVKTSDGRTIPPTYEKLVQNKITLIDRNMVRIKEFMPESSADVVVAAFSLYTVKYPSWEIIKNVYSVLKPGGIFMSTDACPLVPGQKPEYLSEYLAKSGYLFEVHNTEEPYRGMIWRFSIQKTLPMLPDTIISCESNGRNLVSINK